MGWAALETHPRSEGLALNNVRAQGLVAWLPLVPPGLPLFPRYLFVEVETLLRSLWGTRGVSTCLGFVRPAEMVKLRSMQRADGLIELPPRFMPGDRVVIGERGLYQGAAAIFREMEGPERAAVLLTMLGQEVRHVVREAALTAA